MTRILRLRLCSVLFGGFDIHFLQHISYVWQSALATGNVNSYWTVDLQVTAGLYKKALLLKIGSTNVFNNYYYSFIGGPAIGGFYYASITHTLNTPKNNGL
jgi:hypothetical protein